MSENSNLPEVKIDCFTIQVQQHKKKNEERIFQRFDNFEGLNLNSEQIQAKSFEAFFKKYIESFDGKFAVNNLGKALHLNSNSTTFLSENRIIKGIIEGGNTNMGGFIKDQYKAKDENSFILTKDHVEGHPFYYMFYLPSNCNKGILLIQSFSSKSVTELFRRHLLKVFNSFFSNASLVISQFVPKELVQEFKTKGTIDEIVLKKQNLSPEKSEQLLGIQFNEEIGLTIEIKIKGFRHLKDGRDFLNKVMNGDNTKFYEIEELKNIGFDEEFEVHYKYEHKGKVSTVKSTKNFLLQPSFYLEEKDFERDENNLPTIKSLEKYLKSLLFSLCEETSIPAPKFD